MVAEETRRVIRATVLYPTKPGSRFDAEYYLKTHMPLAERLVGSAIKGVTVDIGISGGAPGEPAPFAAITTMTFESVDAFSQAFLPHVQALMNDVPNYTDIEPVLQLSAIGIEK